MPQPQHQVYMRLFPPQPPSELHSRHSIRPQKSQCGLVRESKTTTTAKALDRPTKVPSVADGHHMQPPIEVTDRGGTTRRVRLDREARAKSKATQGSDDIPPRKTLLTVPNERPAAVSPPEGVPETENICDPPRTVTSLSNPAVQEVVDLTLDFEPLSTSTQVPAGSTRKTRVQSEARSKVSNYSSNTVRRDKVIKTTPSARIPDTNKIAGPSSIQDSFSSVPENVDIQLDSLPVLTAVAGPSQPVARGKARSTRTSNVTTPASSNPHDIVKTAPKPSSTKSNSKVREGDAESNVQANTKGTKKTKVKAPLVTPLEYAKRLQEALQPPGQKSRARTPKYLKGKRIFYVGGDMQYAGARTRGRMDFVCFLTPSPSLFVRKFMCIHAT